MPVGENYDTASASTAPFVGSYTPDAESVGTQAYIHHDGLHWLAEPIIGGGSDMSSYVPGDTESVGLYVHKMDDTGYSIAYPVMLPIWFDWFDNLIALGGPDFLCSWEHVVGRSAWNCGVPRGGGNVGCAFASDGTNLWLAVVTRSEEPYPYYHSRYHYGYMTPEVLESFSASGNYFAYQGSFPFCGGSGPGSWDDLGVQLSQRWRPASLFMYVWNGSGFTQIGRVQGQFETGNLATSSLDTGGRVGPPELAASSAQPGVCHALWSENGQYGRRVIDPQNGTYWPYRGSRLVYSSWDAGGQLSENDTLRFDIQDIAPDPPPDLPAMPWWTLTADCRAIDLGGGSVAIYPFHGMQDQLAWTPYYAIRNDHGSPILFVSKQQIWPDTAFLYGDGQSTAGGEATIHAMLPDGMIVQSLTSDLLPTAAENAHGPQGAITPDRVFGDAFAPESSRAGLLSVSSLYDDPLLGGTAVYLLQARWGYLNAGAGFIGDAGEGMYRIPCNASAPFTLLDGDRNLAILPNVNHPQAFHISPISSGPYVPIADFFSETKSVWVPSPIGVSGFFSLPLVFQLDRVCALDWIPWIPFPVNRNGCPRSIPYYDPAASAFYWPDFFENLVNSRIIANICGPTGLHIWHRSPDHR